MKPYMIRFLLCLLSFLVPAFAESTTDRFQVTDVDGKVRTLQSSEQKATVLFFILPDCPISNAYAPEIKRIAAEYAQRNTESWIVYVDPDLSIDAARKHAKDYGLNGPLIVNDALPLASKVGATVAPEVAVLGPEGQRLYLGRIDNLYADYGKRKTNASQRDLRDALNAILQGKPAPHETTKAIGCFISKPFHKANAAE
ncbi:redoxin domain-containing protein [Schlesneria paludicola]|uniref:redoxin domain-containing protein n=1 Tax=Schlesneria paludicola TaxID=360056 RepID=UPI00029B03E5|nr:redoxin domain-containing protein [Schlesneria paludicola]